MVKGFEYNGYNFEFGKRTYIMGILNITPDSFADGGKYFNFEKAIKRAHEMVAEGADIIDIGGESTRPYAETVDLEEEINRVIPVIKALARDINIPISVDTYKAEVARRALDYGATIVNDISGLRFDHDMKKVVADYSCPVIVMHIKGTPLNMQKNPFYHNLLKEIKDYLNESIDIAVGAGLPSEKVIIDPGIGFGKTLAHNLKILQCLEEFRSLGQPLLIGTSNKSFIGKILDAPVTERRFGTAATVAISIVKGADIVRVHDVSEMKQVVQVTDAIVRKNHD